MNSFINKFIKTNIIIFLIVKIQLKNNYILNIKEFYKYYIFTIKYITIIYRVDNTLNLLL